MVVLVVAGVVLIHDLTKVEVGSVDNSHGEGS